MSKTAFVLVALISFGNLAHAQPIPFPGPVPVPPPPIYVSPPAPVYSPYYVRPIYARSYDPFNPLARKGRVLKGVGIPLLSVGVPLVIAGGVVAIVGGTCEPTPTRGCSAKVTDIGFGLLGAGAGLTITGAILLGIGNYYTWASHFVAAVTPTPGGASAAVAFRF
jgi:hypothetical protein